MVVKLLGRECPFLLPKLGENYSKDDIIGNKIDNKLRLMYSKLFLHSLAEQRWNHSPEFVRSIFSEIGIELSTTKNRVRAFDQVGLLKKEGAEILIPLCARKIVNNTVLKLIHKGEMVHRIESEEQILHLEKKGGYFHIFNRLYCSPVDARKAYNDLLLEKDFSLS